MAMAAPTGQLVLLHDGDALVFSLLVLLQVLHPAELPLVDDYPALLLVPGPSLMGQVDSGIHMPASLFRQRPCCMRAAKDGLPATS